ncbi:MULTISPECIES: hypothetical protein [unclassified Providencia]|uniref:hypothetical protein n=1 Tax=unclassified Providencia TaxID=2633465 RepID=UPI002348F7C5|nr:MULTISPECIES: hypothetical protein [unclassified Providencia]
MELETYIKYSYMSLCSHEEVERILNPQSVEDYLLKLRANATVENIRIHRVFLNRMKNKGENWSFESSFDSDIFDDYFLNLNDKDKLEARKIASGLVFCNEPNGRIIKTQFGNVITISESLKYFLYFMNLAFIKFNSDIPVSDSVRINALRIGLRIMLKAESLDFDLDPRGIIPEEIDNELSNYIHVQMLFLVSHEYSHYFLGHMNTANLVDNITHHVIEKIDGKTPKFYTHNQQEELDADIDAIDRQNLSTSDKGNFITAASFFFVYIDILKAVREQISPSMLRVKTHPDPIDRLNNILNFFGDTYDVDKDNINLLINSANLIKNFLQEDLAINTELWEDYGSIYLAEWRGQPLIDRVDY